MIYRTSQIWEIKENSHLVNERWALSSNTRRRCRRGFMRMRFSSDPWDMAIMASEFSWDTWDEAPWPAKVSLSDDANSTHLSWEDAGKKGLGPEHLELTYCIIVIIPPTSSATLSLTVLWVISFLCLSTQTTSLKELKQRTRLLSITKALCQGLHLKLIQYDAKYKWKSDTFLQGVRSWDCLEQKWVIVT